MDWQSVGMVIQYSQTHWHVLNPIKQPPVNTPVMLFHLGHLFRTVASSMHQYKQLFFQYEVVWHPPTACHDVVASTWTLSGSST